MQKDEHVCLSLTPQVQRQLHVERGSSYSDHPTVSGSWPLGRARIQLRGHSLGRADTHRPCSHRSDVGGRQAGCDPSASYVHNAPYRGSGESRDLTDGVDHHIRGVCMVKGAVE